MRTDVHGSLLFLGTGSSMGIPVIGCTCHVCLSKVPYNRRLRSSVLLTIDKKTILVDCGPDFRRQALHYGIHHLDGVIVTHAHYDHVAGFDELRIYSLRSKQPIACLLSLETLTSLKRIYVYIFDEEGPYVHLTAKFQWQLLATDRGDIQFLDIPMRHFSYQQGGMRVDGFRFGSLAYVTDIREYSESIFEDLRGIETLVISAPRSLPSHLHFGVDEAIDFARRVQAKQTWLMHIAHEMDHEHANAYLPQDIRVAYDGLQILF